jgi:hypothetical protein
MTPGRSVVLTEERRTAGYDILKLTDDVGFKASGAAWVWQADSDHWHYLLVSHMIDSEGPIWVYKRLMQVFRKYQLPSIISPLDIKIASPREVNYRDFGFVIDHGSDNPNVFTDLSINKLGIDYMAVYRMTPLPRNAGERTRQFDAKVSELMTAA